MVIFREIVPLIPPNAAVIVTEPAAIPVTTPDTPDTVATPGVEEVQEAEPVRFCVVPSAKFPVAFN